MLHKWLSTRSYLTNISAALSTHSTISINILGQRILWIADPATIQSILSTNADSFHRSAIMQKAFAPLVPNGLVMTNGAEWEHGRKFLAPAFAKAQVTAFDMYERHFQELLLRLPTADGTSVDLQPLFQHYTMDTASELLLGESLHTLRANASAEALEVEQAFDAVNMGCLHRLLMGPLMFLHRDKTFTHSLKLIAEFFNSYIDTAVNQDAASKQPSSTITTTLEKPSRYIFLTCLLHSTPTPSHAILRDQLVTLLIAGRDTTASLLSLTFYLLTTHPTVLSKLLATLPADPPTPNQLPQLTYLQSVIKETQRLLPTVVTVERSARVDTTLPCGGGPNGLSPIFLPKNTQVQMQIYARHRSRALWGPDADSFRPERWEEPQNIHPGWKFVPFGGGRRICPGQALALNETAYLVVRLLQEFAGVEAVEGAEGFVESIATTVGNQNGCWVTLRRK
jgi:cytochrome P450